jgi:hypothetical protein
VLLHAVRGARAWLPHLPLGFRDADQDLQVSVAEGRRYLWGICVCSMRFKKKRSGHEDCKPFGSAPNAIAAECAAPLQSMIHLSLCHACCPSRRVCRQTEMYGQ